MCTLLTSGSDFVWNSLRDFAGSTGIAGFFAEMGWGNVAMICVAFFLLYLAIRHKFEPLLLFTIAFGMLLTNLPDANLYHTELFEGGHVHWDIFVANAGLLDYLYLGVKLGIYPCLTAFRRDGDNAVFGILKHSLEGRRFDVSKAVPVTVTLPVSGHLYDVRNGVYHGCGSTIQTKLVPGQAQLFSILKEKVESVRIEAPGEITRGAMLPVTISAGSGSQVFHLEFLAPDGKAAPLYARNLRFENGSGTYSFQTALNDAPGRWTLVVKNVNSGLSAKQTVNLKP